MSLEFPQCAMCRHLLTPSIPACKAFDRIPKEIWSWRVDHRKPVEGDRGIRFDPYPGMDEQEVNALFDRLLGMRKRD